VLTVNLALQGGGAHGAFAWGVLERLLEVDDLTIEGISATSAGAANAAVLAYGMTVGGREGATRSLEKFWREVARAARRSPWQPSLWDRLARNFELDHSPTFLILDLLTRVASPYQLNPLNYNPLRHVLERVVDFDVLRSSAIKLFLSATNVRTGKIKIFAGDEISVNAVLASACLPFLFQAVEIDGEHYWDGGYMGNPALFPLIYHCATQDILMIHINPIVRSDVPTTATDILNRVNEISFNSSMMREVRAVAFVNDLIRRNSIPGHRMKEIRLHAIEAERVMQGLGAASKLNADWDFLRHLHGIGRQHTDEWLSKDFAKVGRRTSIDIAARYL
jgi:NTE family protein